MADFTKAVQYVLENEGGYFEDPSTGEISKFGISLKWLESISPTATVDVVRNMSREAAISLYKAHWWDAGHFELVANDNISTKLLDMCVNCGLATGVKMLQSVLNEPLEEHEERVSTDGVIGPQVAIAVAKEVKYQGGEFALLAALVSACEERYEAIAEKYPERRKDLPGWLKRAERLPG